MKIAIVTANIGDIDEVIKPVNQYRHDVTFINLTSQNGAKSDRHAAKKLKSTFYKELKEYDFYIWIDGTVQITSSNFVEYILDMCELSDMGIVVHPDRSTLKEEYDYIEKHIKTSEYLRVRYENEDFETEKKAFSKKLDAKLYNARIFVLNKNYAKFMEEWAKLIDKYTVFDQTQFSYLIDKYKSKIKFKELYWGDLYKYCQVNKHKKLA